MSETKRDVSGLLSEAQSCITQAGELLNRYTMEEKTRDIEGARNQLTMAFSLIGLVLRKAKEE